MRAPSHQPLVLAVNCIPECVSIQAQNISTPWVGRIGKGEPGLGIWAGLPILFLNLVSVPGAKSSPWHIDNGSL
jgi:hypothetical protein